MVEKTHTEPRRFGVHATDLLFSPKNLARFPCMSL